MSINKSRLLTALVAAPVVSAASVTLGAMLHACSYRINSYQVQLQGKSTKSAGLKILHISDTHLMKYQHRRLAFLKSLAKEQPDLIILTGDLIAQGAAIEPLIDALSGLSGIPGAYVYGSNDYYAPKVKNPLRYIWKNSNSGSERKQPNLPTAKLSEKLNSLGWINLNNATASIKVKNWEIELIGVNDPHINLDRFPKLEKLDHFPEANRVPQVDHVPNINTDSQGNRKIRIGLAHAPYQRVLNTFANMNCDIVFAGHTHGGQVCLPGQRALVTNCDLPTAYASGLFTWSISNPINNPTSNTMNDPISDSSGSNIASAHELNEQAPQHRELRSQTFQSQESHAMLVEVSAGIGTSPYTPVRTFCPPEAVVIQIVDFP